MATYWANLALAPVNGFSNLNHLPSMHLPTRVESDVLKRARLVLRQESSSTLPEELLQFSAARTVAELVFYVIEWVRMPAAFNPAKSVLEFCMDMLADKGPAELPGECAPFASYMSAAGDAGDFE
jgi:hypothetical protein